MNILVRNMDRAVTEEMLVEKFSPFGAVASVTIVLDKVTGLSKGFGFVDMPDEKQGQAAIKALDHKLVLKQKIRVKQAAPRKAEAGAAPGAEDDQQPA